MKLLTVWMPIFFLLGIAPQIDENPSGKIQIVKDYQNIDSFAELVALFPNKVLYIDMWATWCGPCRQEFSYTPDLKSYAADKEIEFVYISLDKQRATAQWKRFIQEFKIEGHHLLANEKLRADLKENYYTVMENREKKIYMPAYLIVDKNSKVFDRDARRPSEGKKLFKQLKKALKK